MWYIFVLQIAINGSHFCEYRHRIPKDIVRQLTVEGDVQLSQIRFQGGSVSFNMEFKACARGDNS